jgi:hypothetical protein
VFNRYFLDFHTVVYSHYFAEAAYKFRMDILYSGPSAAVPTLVWPQNSLQMRLERIKQLQGHIIGVLAVMGGRAEVEIDSAGKWPDAVDATVLSSEIEKGAVAGIVDSFRQQIQHLLFVGKHIGPAPAAAAGRAAGRSNFTGAKGMLEYPPSETVRCPVEEGNLPPVITPGPFVPDHTPL